MALGAHSLATELPQMDEIRVGLDLPRIGEIQLGRELPKIGDKPVGQNLSTQRGGLHPDKGNMIDVLA